MQDWQDFFTLCYHPSPGIWIIHWKSSSKPALDASFSEKKQAEIWLKYKYREILDKSFEEIVLE